MATAKKKTAARKPVRAARAAGAPDANLLADLMKWAKDAGSSPEDLERFATYTIATRDMEIATLREENEALRRDAERYRWLRGEHSRIDPCIKANAKYRLERDSSTWVNIHDLDAAIDAAMEDKT